MNDTEINTSTKCSAVDKQLCFLYQGTTYDGKYKNPHCRKCIEGDMPKDCLLYTSPSPRDATLSRMPSSA